MCERWFVNEWNWTIRHLQGHRYIVYMFGHNLLLGKVVIVYGQPRQPWSNMEQVVIDQLPWLNCNDRSLPHWLLEFISICWVMKGKYHFAIKRGNGKSPWNGYCHTKINKNGCAIDMLNYWRVSPTMTKLLNIVISYISIQTVFEKLIRVEDPYIGLFPHDVVHGRENCG